VLAARIENREDHQIGIREEPLLSFRTRGFGDARKFAQMPVLRETAEVLQANAGEPGNFVLGEELLARLDSYHILPQTSFDGRPRVNPSKLTVQ